MVRPILIVAAMGAVLAATQPSRAADAAAIGKRLLPIPADAQRLALADAEAMLRRGASADDLAATRWVWVRSGKRTDAQLVGLTINYVSRSRLLHKPVITAGSLVRVDLKRYAESAGDLRELLVLWEDFRFDPSFATLITRDTLALSRSLTVRPGVAEVGKRRLLINTEPYTDESGERQTQRWVDTVAVPGIHLEDEVEQRLRALTGSRAPVVESRYLTFRALSTVKDRGVYSDVWGGRYYDLAGIKTVAKGGKGTDLDLLFEQLGIGSVGKSLNAKQVFAVARSEQRIAMFRSRVTGKPRLVVFLPTLATRFGAGQGFVSITFDIRDGDLDVGDNVMANLSKVDSFTALEVIWRMPNGLQGFGLFDGQGKRQDEAPPDVVVDHRIPERAGTKRLQGAISCIRCHGFDGSDGMKPAPNDVALFRKRYLDIFGDLNDKAGQASVFELFAGDHEAGLATARRQYIQAILAANGVLAEDAKEAQVNIGRLTALAYADLWERFWYDSVTPQTALAELGYDVPAKDAAEFLRKLLPPPKLDRKPLPGSFIPEDPRLAGLLMDVPGGIPRSDWALAYSFAAARARKTEAAKIADGK